MRCSLRKGGIDAGDGEQRSQTKSANGEIRREKYHPVRNFAIVNAGYEKFEDPNAIDIKITQVQSRTLTPTQGKVHSFRPKRRRSHCIPIPALYGMTLSTLAVDVANFRFVPSRAAFANAAMVLLVISLMKPTIVALPRAEASSC